MKLKMNYVTNANEMQNAMTPINTKKTPMKRRTKRTKKNYDTQNFPPLKRKANTQLAPKARKRSLIERLCENVLKLVLGIDMPEVNVALLIVVSQKMKSNINMLGLRMKHWILSHTNGTRAITQQRHFSKLKTKIL